MHPVLPARLSRALRGICPTCGVPLDLEQDGAMARCGYCGGEARLQYRLRRLEPDLPHPAADRRLERDAQGLERWQDRLGVHEEVHCPGCAAPFEAKPGDSIASCPHCGTQSKLELRLLPIWPDDVAEPQRRSRADFRNEGRNGWTHPWDIETEQTLWRFLHEPDRDHRIALGILLTNWGCVDATAAYFLPRVLDHLREEDEVVVHATAPLIGRLLCANDDALILPTIQACQRAVHQSLGTGWLLDQLGLGPPLAIKTLLDAAEAAEARGDLDHLHHALAAVQWIFGRHFDLHQTMVRIVVHRLFTMGPRVTGWAMTMLRSRFHHGAFLPWDETLRAIDDLAEERPLLVPALRASLFVSDTEDRGEYARRVAALRELDSPLARGAACAVLGAPPPDAALCRAAVEGLDPLLDDPITRDDATAALLDLLRGERERVAAALRPLVERRGESLPERFKREYLHFEPDTPHLDTTQVYYWQSVPDEVLGEEERRLSEEWDRGIDRVVQDRQSPAGSRRAVERARSLDVPVFLEDEPPTISFVDPEEERREAERQEEERLRREIEEINAEHEARVTELLRAQERYAVDDPRRHELIEQTQKLVEETMRRLQDRLS